MTNLYCQGYCLADIEAIVFDKDGTLANSRDFLEKLASARVQRCVEAVQLRFGCVFSGLAKSLRLSLGLNPYGLDPEGLMAVGTRQANEQAMLTVLRQAGVDADDLAVLVREAFEAAASLLQPKAAYTPPFPGTQALLSRLGTSSLRVGVFSSDSAANVDEFLTYYGLHPWVDDWQGTAPGDLAKPEPTLLYRLCDRLQVNVARTVIIGDSWTDLQLAKNAGTAEFLAVSEGWGRSPVAGASLILTTWDDLTIGNSQPNSHETRDKCGSL